jgi:cell fate regulator YaaT (PSP1 superfamily)
MNNILYVLDWLTVKPIQIPLKANQLITDFKPGDQIIYSLSEDNKLKYMIGNNIGYPCECNKEGNFVRLPRDDEKQQFIASQKKVQPYFDIFKKKFKEKFANAKPINVRTDMNGTVAYFYFHCEERLNFVDFLKEFRALVPIHFFFYQV